MLQDRYKNFYIFQCTLNKPLFYFDNRKAPVSSVLEKRLVKFMHIILSKVKNEMLENKINTFQNYNILAFYSFTVFLQCTIISFKSDTL